MRSVNSAEKFGREIGRTIPDVWISDEALMREVRRGVFPRLSLRDTDEDKREESAGTLFGLMVCVTIVAVVAMAARIAPPQIWGGDDFHEPAATAIAKVPVAYLVLATVVCGMRFVVAGVIYAKAKAAARASYAKAVDSLCSAAFFGAQAALSRRRGSVGTPLSAGMGSAVWSRPRPIARRFGSQEAGTRRDMDEALG